MSSWVRCPDGQAWSARVDNDLAHASALSASLTRASGKKVY